MRQHENTGSRSFRGLSAAAATVVLIVLASPGFSAGPSKGGGTAGGSRWVRIDYDDLIDRSALTHSDQTVGDLLKTARKGAGLPKNVLSNLQPYLEPFSFVCNDIVTAMRPPGEKPYANILDDYPPGSRQPAWAALFREGRYHLFFVDNRARLFLKGEKPASLFRRNRSVVRHPLLKILEKTGGGRIRLEVYAFKNDYASRTVSLDLRPYVAEITPRDCAPENREFPREEVADFFAQGPILEAAEIEEGGDFYLYGSRAGRQTVAGEPVSIEDFAVVYRAVFHHGNNPPYVSLDQAEDNRYAKVNFGGLMQDTRVGNVLLEADKLFKTIVTGLDPDKRTLIADKIKTAVPEFRTVDERTLFQGKAERVKVRFWFYPDRIRTVTDGRIGVVESYQFTADEERMDGKVRSYPAGREGIDHLNRNFASYAGVLPPFGELQTVGRMMAIVKWLHDTDARRRFDLDDLLSVELPPIRTPLRIRKIISVTDGIRISHGTSFEEFRKVYCLDNILEQCTGTMDDPTILDRAMDQTKSLGIETFLAGGRQVCPAAVTRSTAISVNGGVDLNPAGLAPPRKSPDSPLIARIRNARLSETKSSADGGTGLIRSKLRRSTSPPVKAEKPSVSRKNGPATAKNKPVGKPLAFEPASRALTKEVVVTTNAYPAEIIVTANQSAVGTIVLKKGRPIGGN